MLEQYHFEFKDYEAAFEMFYRKKKSNPAICLVISTGFEVSGYWVEADATEDKDTAVYRSVRTVKALEKRVKAKRNSTVALGLGGVVV